MDRPRFGTQGDILPPVPHNIQARSRRPRRTIIAREIDLAARRHRCALVFPVRGYRHGHPVPAAIHGKPRPRAEVGIYIDLRVLRNRGLIPPRRPGHRHRNPRAILVGFRPRAVCAIIAVDIDFTSGHHRGLVLPRGRHRHTRPIALEVHWRPGRRRAETGVDIDKPSAVDGGLVLPRGRHRYTEPVARAFLRGPGPHAEIRIYIDIRRTARHRGLVFPVRGRYGDTRPREARRWC